jgi:hypothetical protein
MWIWRASGTRRLLLPLDFGEPGSDVGMLGLKLACVMKGGRGFGKFPFCQTRVAVRKGLERKVLAGYCLWWDDRGGRVPAVPTPYDPPCAYNDDHYDDYVFHVVPSFVVPLHLDAWRYLQEGISLA